MQHLWWPSLFDSSHGGSYGDEFLSMDPQIQLFASHGAIKFPLEQLDAWTEKIKKLDLLLTIKESAMDVPTNLEARRSECRLTSCTWHTTTTAADKSQCPPTSCAGTPPPSPASSPSALSPTVQGTPPPPPASGPRALPPTMQGTPPLPPAIGPSALPPAVQGTPPPPPAIGPSAPVGSSTQPLQDVDNHHEGKGGGAHDGRLSCWISGDKFEPTGVVCHSMRLVIVHVPGPIMSFKEFLISVRDLLFDMFTRTYQITSGQDTARACSVWEAIVQTNYRMTLHEARVRA